MMPLKGKLLSIKRTHLLGLFILLCISIICVAFSMSGSDGFDLARREILLRRVGHEVLLQSGDSTSRVLPVKKISKNEYQVSFENPLSFQPESLVNTTQRLLAQDPLAKNYVVNVLNCANDSVAYGYAISKNKKDDIVACLGRRQPVACYKINIRFKPEGIITARNGYLVGGLTVLAFVGLIMLRSPKRRSIFSDNQSAVTVESTTGSRNPSSTVFTLGSMSFDAQARKLTVDAHMDDGVGQGKTIELTKTETRVLHIFASAPNQVIERSRLQKEIWEDEGVIVGRSLDMFISKLRKKLEVDPNVRIVVVRGKGYKLEISS